MSNLETFAFESSAVRAVLVDGDPWFCAKDVCDVLGYKNAVQTISDHCVEKGVSKRYTPTSGGGQELVFINEPNLYRLIIKSRKPEAQRFEQWVMEEVLPSIRKHGRYEMPAAASSSMPTSVSHRADHVVSATRCFNGLMRAASALRLGQNRAALAANQAAIRYTGVDILNELGVEPEELPEDARRPTQDDTLPLIKAWLAAPEQVAVDRFTGEEIVAGVFDIVPGDPDYRSAVTRAGIALARLGWQHCRSTGPGRQYYYKRPG